MILVTGSNGYIGKYLTLSLIGKGYLVRGLVHPNDVRKTAPVKGVELWYGDLTVPETLKGIGKGISTVVHMAGVHSSF